MKLTFIQREELLKANARIDKGLRPRPKSGWQTGTALSDKGLVAWFGNAYFLTELGLKTAKLIENENK